jgi:hypothetical protein
MLQLCHGGLATVSHSTWSSESPSSVIGGGALAALLGAVLIEFLRHEPQNDLHSVFQPLVLLRTQPWHCPRMRLDMSNRVQHPPIGKNTP